MTRPDPRIRLFRTKLARWGRSNIKDFTWRRRRDPYSVLVAEFMLHRTQAHQAETVYREFIKAYPTLEVFARADRKEVKTILTPLGLNWRIDGMLEVLDSLWEKYGEVPADRERLIKERNVGQYIAGATTVFSTEQPHPLVDTNTVRVVGRVFGLNLEGEARRRKEVIQAIDEVCDPKKPRDFYFAMIDLAHEICKPKDPLCELCPLLNVPCAYGQAIVDA